MNRLSAVLLTALVVSIATSLSLALFQQRTISTLRRENAQLVHPSGNKESIAVANIAGRYQWLRDGVDSGVITLNSDHTFVGATGKTSYDGQEYRWFYQGGQLLIVWGDTHMRFTESSGSGNFFGTHGKKPVQIIKLP